ITAPRRPRSAWLLVGSTPGTLAKLQRAGQRLSRFLAKVRWRRLRALFPAASSSSARSSSLSGSTLSSRRARSASARNSAQAANSPAATRRPAAPENSSPSSRQPALVDVDGRRGAHVAEQVFVGLLQSGARAADDGLDGTARELGAEELAKELCGIAARDAIAYCEGGDGRLEARAEGARRHPGRQRRRCRRCSLRMTAIDGSSAT